jgi:hypothetical protein
LQNINSTKAIPEKDGFCILITVGNLLKESAINKKLPQKPMDRFNVEVIFLNQLTGN